MKAVLDGTRRHGGDDVVGFVAGRDERRNAHRFAEFLDVRDLLREVGGHLLASRLVELVLRVTLRRGGTVERDRDVVGRILLQHPLQHDGEAVCRVRRDAMACGKTLDREVCAVGLRHSVDDEKEWVLDHGLYRTPQRRSGVFY